MVPNDFIPLARETYNRPRVLQLPPSVKDYLPLTFFMLFFTNEIFQVLILYTNINADKYF